MKSDESFLFITIAAAAVSLVIGAPTLGGQSSHCVDDGDCERPLICLKSRCEINYCITPIFNQPHATCIPIPHGYDAECNEGYEDVSGECEPVKLSSVGVEGHKCAESYDCLASLACMDNRCTNICEFFELEPHVLCRTEFHKPMFTCDDGYRRTDYWDPTCEPIPSNASRTEG